MAIIVRYDNRINVFLISTELLKGFLHTIKLINIKKICVIEIINT